MEEVKFPIYYMKSTGIKIKGEIIMQDNSNWRKLIDYINSHNIGDIINRKELTSLNFVYPNELRMSSLAQSTLDSYRRYLTLCRYLDDRDSEGNKLKRGTYVLLRYIPITLTLNECRRKAYERKY